MHRITEKAMDAVHGLEELNVKFGQVSLLIPAASKKLREDSTDDQQAIHIAQLTDAAAMVLMALGGELKDRLINPPLRRRRK